MQEDSHLYSDISATIIRGFYTVYNKLGFRFLEKVYENALKIELRKLGLLVNQQVPVKVFYDGDEVGFYFADMVINDVIIIELKAGTGLIEEHEAQLTNYLKATNIEVGLLLNFGVTPSIKRKAFSNKFKGINPS